MPRDLIGPSSVVLTVATKRMNWFQLQTEVSNVESKYKEYKGKNCCKLSLAAGGPQGVPVHLR